MKVLEKTTQSNPIVLTTVCLTVDVAREYVFLSTKTEFHEAAVHQGGGPETRPQQTNQNYLHGEKTQKMEKSAFSEIVHCNL